MPELDPSFSVTIASGQALSSIADMKNFTLCGIYVPSSFTGTSLTFFAGPTLATPSYSSVRDGAGNAISKTVAPGQYIPVDPVDFIGVRFLKIQSGSNEAADRTVTLVGRDM